MIELLGCSLIILLLCLEAYLIHQIYTLLKERSDRKQDERRAASRPRIYREVRSEWEQYRNRKALWDYLNKQ